MRASNQPIADRYRYEARLKGVSVIVEEVETYVDAFVGETWWDC